MSARFFSSGEHAGGLDNVVSASFAPRNVFRIHAGINVDSLSVHDEFAVFGFKGAVEFAVDRVVLGHVNHVVQIDERVIDRDNFKFFRLSHSCTENESSDTAKAIDTNFNSHCKTSK